MKYLGLAALFLLAGCQSVPTFCDNQPASDLCNASTYSPVTAIALKEFESRSTRKAFAIGQTLDGWEFYGYSEGYSSQREANERALKECQVRLDHQGQEGKCELIR